jgi:hypothetical protein
MAREGGLVQRPPDRPLLQEPHVSRTRGQQRKVTASDWHYLIFRTAEIFLLKSAEWLATQGWRVLFVLLLLHFGQPFFGQMSKELLAVAFK